MMTRESISGMGKGMDANVATFIKRRKSGKKFTPINLSIDF